MLFQKYGIHQNQSVLTYRENSEKLNEIKDLWYQFYFYLHVHYISAKISWREHELSIPKPAVAVTACFWHITFTKVISKLTDNNLYQLTHGQNFGKWNRIPHHWSCITIHENKFISSRMRYIRKVSVEAFITYLAAWSFFFCM